MSETVSACILCLSQHTPQAACSSCGFKVSTYHAFYFHNASYYRCVPVLAWENTFSTIPSGVEWKLQKSNLFLKSLNVFDFPFKPVNHLRKEKNKTHNYTQKYNHS